MCVCVRVCSCVQCVVIPSCQLSWPGFLPPVQSSSTRSCCPVPASTRLCTGPAGQLPSLQLRTGRHKHTHTHTHTQGFLSVTGVQIYCACVSSLLVLGLRNMEGSCDPTKLVSQFLLRKTLVQVRRRILQCCRPGYPDNIVKVTAHQLTEGCVCVCVILCDSVSLLDVL